jgi:hypothetical protein
LARCLNHEAFKGLTLKLSIRGAQLRGEGLRERGALLKVTHERCSLQKKRGNEGDDKREL